MEAEGDDGHLEVCKRRVVPTLVTSCSSLQMAKLLVPLQCPNVDNPLLGTGLVDGIWTAFCRLDEDTCSNSFCHST